MAGIISKFFVFIVSIIVMINLINNNGGNASVLDSIKKSISNGIDSVLEEVQGAACLIQNREDFDGCQNQINYWYSNIDGQRDRVKEYCCAFISYKQCLNTVARLRCGSKAQETVDGIMNAMKKGLYPSDCDPYDNIVDCMDPLLFWAIFALIVVIIFILFCSLIGCLKRTFC
ncbi:hypothetical protein HUG17_0171 [Dermatophagoides farinae]|uniref:Uncharacterized protein n=1 Tax=Dermatophagoides farinae TaxID=6954 RepID=A0A9D4SK06_DERFA|nr:uncharacterized protein LOC124500125 [Dermatophagoides farinae]KAH7644633.1 hypothetical protein HUG17_0171 [Dermatophagoides farinae]